MFNKITLDNNEFQFNESLLPCLVTGIEKSGASYLSICLISNLIQLGSKVIFFTAFPMAKEELLKQVNPKELFEVTSEDDIASIPSDFSVLVQSGNVELWQKVLQNIKALDDYVVFVKNIEEYSQLILEVIGDHKKILLSGNLEVCNYKDKVMKKDWLTRIVFNEQGFNSDIKLPELQKYESFLINQKQRGILRLLSN